MCEVCAVCLFVGVCRCVSGADTDQFTQLNLLQAYDALMSNLGPSSYVSIALFLSIEIDPLEKVPREYSSLP